MITTSGSSEVRCLMRSWDVAGWSRDEWTGPADFDPLVNPGVEATAPRLGAVWIPKETLMRSIRGVLGASVLLLALPVTIVFQLIFDAGAETVIHVCLALGLRAEPRLGEETW